MMKRLLLALPFVVAACNGDRTATLTAPSEITASRGGDNNDGNNDNDGGQSSNRVVVSPANMHGWAFYDDNTGGPCLVTVDCRMVTGPREPPLGVGSAELAANVLTEANHLGLFSRYNGVLFRTVTSLSYWTYRQSPPDPSVLAIALQFNVDYDLSDANTTWQGRVVFEPYLTGATVRSNKWQRWNAQAGRGWWSTEPAAALAANPAAAPCTQAAPCSWAELIAKYPRSGVHQALGKVLLQAGGFWTLFRGNTDALTIGVAGRSTTYDFEPYRIAKPHDSDDEDDDGE
jgi:hypothetical protein